MPELAVSFKREIYETVFEAFLPTIRAAAGAGSNGCKGSCNFYKFAPETSQKLYEIGLSASG